MRQREKSDLILGEREDYTGTFPASPFPRMGLEVGEAFGLSSKEGQRSKSLRTMDIYSIWLNTLSLFEVMGIPHFL